MSLERSRRAVAGLYWAWALFQAIGAIHEAGVGPDELPKPVLYWLLMVFVVVAYAFGGVLLWRNLAGGWGLGIALAVLALLAFPLGTILGIVALVALLRRRPQAASKDVAVKRRRRILRRPPPPQPPSQPEVPADAPRH